jgi:hypothetical protein
MKRMMKPISWVLVWKASDDCCLWATGPGNHFCLAGEGCVKERNRMAETRRA